MNFLTYLFYPNPANSSYTNPNVMALLVACALLLLISMTISVWRKRASNPVTKKLSRSWATACFWFGITGLVMAVSRVEEISYLSMRSLWVVWAALIVLYLVFQVKVWRARHYEVMPKESMDDPREKYLPKQKR